MDNSRRSPSPRPSSARHVTFADKQPSGNYQPPRHPVQNTPQNWSWPDNETTRSSSSWQNGRDSSGRDFRPRSFSSQRRWQSPGPQFNPQRQYQPRPLHDWQSGYNTQNLGQSSYGSGQSSNFSSPTCRNCMTAHPPDPNLCLGKGKRCFNCNRLGHLKIACRSPPANRGGYNPNFQPQQ
jgi:hypothetical protein